ncbi:DUF423 domain-containing protein [uncultured Formosa sp.]|uniref:DUF423 domain-containing protein n=1 Tax=uncultured Formosa sp. TaxID=255435 RepID=UPI00260F51C8|nr:DUF423 domain-containing protein [uncultured Formosa sp.]
MKKWNFKLKGNPKEISKNMESALKSVNGIVFNLNHEENNSATFKMRKRILYPWYLLYLNSIVVNGKLSNIDSNNETGVEIYFNQHFLWKSVIFTDIILGLGFLITLILGKHNTFSRYAIGTLILAVIILILIIVRKKYKKNIQEYKTLISGILKTEKNQTLNTTI